MVRNREHSSHDILLQILDETHENNIMLKQICKVINYHLAYAQQENENDFGRNVIANLISNIVDVRRLKH